MLSPYSNIKNSIKLVLCTMILAFCLRKLFTYDKVDRGVVLIQLFCSFYSSMILQYYLLYQLLRAPQRKSHYIQGGWLVWPTYILAISYEDCMYIHINSEQQTQHLYSTTHNSIYHCARHLKTLQCSLYAMRKHLLAAVQL